MIFADATPRYCALALAPNCALLSTLLPVGKALQQQAMKKRGRATKLVEKCTRHFNAFSLQYFQFPFIFGIFTLLWNFQYIFIFFFQQFLMVFCSSAGRSSQGVAFSWRLLHFLPTFKTPTLCRNLMCANYLGHAQRASKGDVPMGNAFR